MGAVVVRSSITECEGLATPGQIFGALFLAPLIADGYAPVIASYGPAESGKSTFGRAAIEQLPSFFAAYEYEMHRPSSAASIVDAVSDQGAFRYRDFGPLTVNPFETRPMSDYFDLMPRKDFAQKDARYLRGVDYFEHPPFSHLAHADVIVIIGRKRGPAYDLSSGSYFAKMASNIAGQGLNLTDQAGQPTRINPRTRTILEEMKKMDSWINIPTEASKNVPRAAIFILANQRPPFRQAFENFAQFLALR